MEKRLITLKVDIVSDENEIVSEATKKFREYLESNFETVKVSLSSVISNPKCSKEVIYSWTEMRKLKVPQECPTDLFENMTEWIRINVDRNFESREDITYFAQNGDLSVEMLSTDSDDWRITETEIMYES